MTATIAYTNAMRAGNPHTARDIAKRELGAATKCLQHYIWRIRMDKASDALALKISGVECSAAAFSIFPLEIVSE